MVDGLLLLHAFPLDAQMWGPQLEALDGTVAVAAPHLPGFGGTPLVGDVTTMAVAADRALEAMDAAGIDRAVVCGLSLGGYVAFELWRRARARIAGLVLANTRAAADTPEAAEARRELARRLRREGNGFLVAEPTDPRRFAERYPFALDRFQLDAIDAVHRGDSVLVAAPTGSGKTVVAEFAVERALATEGKAFYTTPLKALSNQKFGDLVARYGAATVGLLTGDNTINSEAPVVVMTTEVLRNMLYEKSPTLQGLLSVVMDEVHYLQDPYRGAVWEEVLIHLPLSVSVVCLSATISNAEEFGEWVGTLRGPTRVVIEERRPVPLEHHYLIGHDLHPMHVPQDGRQIPNPYIVSLDREEVRYKTYYRRGSGTAQHQRIPRPREGHRRVYVPRREEVVDVLSEHGMLPAIYFVFSRAGCDRSVEWLMASGIRLTTAEEAARIRGFAEMRVAWMDEEDLSTLGFYDFAEALSAGIAAHHAGMLPVFKETVEELFEAGLVKIVFATETLSLGINMP
ncbi:MAG: alpha/beta fold hydrolase, partial [Candidatus Velamenicoccus archaeovorus]